MTPEFCLIGHGAITIGMGTENSTPEPGSGVNKILITGEAHYEKTFKPPFGILQKMKVFYS